MATGSADRCEGKERLIYRWTWLSGGDGDDSVSADFYSEEAFRLYFGNSFNRTSEPEYLYRAADVPESGHDSFRIDITSGSGGELFLAAEAGDDTVDATLSKADRVTIDITTGTGDDIIEATAKSAASTSTDPTDKQVTVSAGAGADRIVTNASSGDSGRAINSVYGQDDDDSIVMTTTMNGNGGGLARSIASGGIGDDAILVTAFACANAANARVVSTLYGNSGNDTIEAVSGTSGDAVSDQRQELYGGSGDDHLAAAATLLSIFAGKVVNNLDGADGADHLVASIETCQGSDVTNLLDGGAASDVLEAVLRFSGEAEGSALGQNKLFGGDGADQLTATVTGGTGKSSLFGGAGDDSLTVVGGTGNVLQGDAGDDMLVGGSGSDGMRGGVDDDDLFGGAGRRRAR